MINHVEIYVNDIEGEFLFWTKIMDLLDLKIIDKWKSGFSIGKEKSYIAFNKTQNSKTKIPYKRINQGINHICFVCYKSKKSILEQFKIKQIKILYQNKTIDENVIFFENNWGLKIELLFSTQPK